MGLLNYLSKIGYGSLHFILLDEFVHFWRFDFWECSLHSCARNLILILVGCLFMFPNGGCDYKGTIREGRRLICVSMP